MKRTATIISFISVLLLIVVFLFIVDLHKYANESADQDTSKKIITIHPGQSFNRTLDELTHSGIIKDPIKFKILARLKGRDNNLKAGEYDLSPSMTPATVLDRIIKGNVLLHKVTVPEGYNIQQIATLIGKSGLCAEDRFLKTALNASFARKMDIAGNTFEGYLFPDTYYFSRDVSPEKIIRTMHKRFKTVFTDQWRERAKKLGFSVHDIVTLASIIEKETGASQERPVISSVFHNRLKKRMRLESDPTVIYGMADFNGNITKKDLRTHTPYNTYKIKGLPPGPIANPGREALKAALYPAETRFLYFVSKRDTTHKFSTNIKDHNQAVRKYQLLRR